MESVLVMGITGTFARHMAQALITNGYKVSAFMRDPTKLPENLKGINVIQGDIKDIHSVRRACNGIDIVIYGINPPNYDWEGKALPYLENLAKVAEEKELCVVFPGNVYVFNPNINSHFCEDSEFDPITRKGEIRKTMEQRLQLAANRGAKIIILRMGDFIAPDSIQSSWLPRLLKSTRHGYMLHVTGPSNLKHTWAYLPDATNAIIRLLKRRAMLDAFSIFHFKGFSVSFNEIAQTITQTTGESVQVKTFPWWFIKVAAPFSVMFSGLLEMRYLWNKELILTDDKLQATLGDSLHFTPLAEALRLSHLIEIPTASSEQNIRSC